MDTDRSPADSPPALRAEPEAQERNQFVEEAELIAEARAELDAGLFVASADIDSWIESIGTDHELLPPQTRG